MSYHRGRRPHASTTDGVTLQLAMLADAFVAIQRRSATSYMTSVNVEWHVRQEYAWLTRPATGEWGGSARDVCEFCGINYGLAIRKQAAVVEAAREYLARCDQRRANKEGRQSAAG